MNLNEAKRKIRVVESVIAPTKKRAGEKLEKYLEENKDYPEGGYATGHEDGLRRGFELASVEAADIELDDIGLYLKGE